MRFSMLYSREQILSFKQCLVFYAGDSLTMSTVNYRPRGSFKLYKESIIVLAFLINFRIPPNLDQ